ncbi:thiopurine S-methyltransferase [Psychrobacter pygoscelis]|uniref:thiopurine S-methyltransferase n=1 Tax=Psychrobacter pygoscelis TaxID=2488563 RepID=UPI00103FF8D2|nr:thiopurine S-methyltransferase [Psychrobacter pygoscelis]
MEAKFWQDRWANKKIGFHEPEVNPKLATYFYALDLASGSRIFVPLCGMTCDIGWLARQGHDVVGIELVESAVVGLFEALDVIPSITQHRHLTHYYVQYAGRNIDIWVGDILEMTIRDIGPVDAIYDRAALVALPDTPPQYLRSRYTQQLIDLTNSARQLVITFDFDQERRPGPPFVITTEQLQTYYGAHYQLDCLEDIYLEALLRDGTPGRSLVWLLKKHG